MRIPQLYDCFQILANGLEEKKKKSRLINNTRQKKTTKGYLKKKSGFLICKICEV